MAINAGDLNKRIQIYNKATTQNEYGAISDTWELISNTFANIKPLGGRELYNAKQLHEDATFNITVRYKSGLNTTMRFKFHDRHFDILNIINVDEKNECQVCLCKEVI